MITTRHREPFTIALRFTADVIEPDPPCELAGGVVNDCQCTNVYGEPTEHGYGQTLTSGWHDPDWSMDNVQDEPTDPESIDYTDPYEDHVERLADRILRTVGVPDHVDNRGGDVTVYPADPDRDFRTGTEVMVAAHVEGLGPAEADRLTEYLHDWRNR